MLNVKNPFVETDVKCFVGRSIFSHKCYKRFVWFHVVRCKPQVIIDWNDACVKDSKSGKVIPIRQAVSDGLISRETGELLKKKLDSLPFRGHDVQDHREDREKDSTEDDTVTLTFQTTKVVEPSLKAITVEEQMDTGKIKTVLSHHYLFIKFFLGGSVEIFQQQKEYVIFLR